MSILFSCIARATGAAEIGGLSRRRVLSRVSVALLPFCVVAASLAQSASGSEPGRSIEIPDSFSYIEEVEGKTRLVARGTAIPLGEAGDHFASHLEVAENRILTAGTRWSDEGSELVLVETTFDRDGTASLREVEPPRAVTGMAQSSPRVIAAANSDVRFTAVWFEGNDPRFQELWTADQRAKGFSRPHRIAGAGPGSQVALQAATLDNGEQLLVWAGWDGEDSEILWAKREPNIAENQGWSKPRRLNPANDVPDITPALVSVNGGALAAWSWYDGETYRLVLSRFDGIAWTAPEVISERAGIYPQLKGGSPNSLSGANPTLSFKQVGPARWTYRRLDDEGRELGAVSLPAVSEQRPPILAANQDTLILASPRPDAASQGELQDRATERSRRDSQSATTAAEYRARTVSNIEQTTITLRWQQQ